MGATLWRPQVVFGVRTVVAVHCANNSKCKNDKEGHSHAHRLLVAAQRWVVSRTWRPQTEQGPKLQSMTHRSDIQPGINTQAQSQATSSLGLLELTSAGLTGDLTHRFRPTQG